MATPVPPARSTADLSTGTWLLDPDHSGVEFHVRHFYGLMTVKGSFSSYRATLQLGSRPAVELTIDADSLETHQAKRDTHLRSADFFDVEHHPQVRFLSDSAVIEADTLKVHGQLHAAGKQIPLQVDAGLRVVDGELEIDAVAEADHRLLGMTWSPLGILRAPSKLIVRGRLIGEGEAAGTRQDSAAAASATDPGPDAVSSPTSARGGGGGGGGEARLPRPRARRTDSRPGKENAAG